MWLTKITPGSHGSNPTQKRYWRVVSDYVRIRDWHEFQGKCIACDRHYYSWKDLQGGHYKSWGACRGYSKWDRMNIFGECGICNTGFNSNVVGANFEKGIIKRYGKKRMSYISSLDSYPTEKMDDYIIMKKIKQVILEMKDLPEQPDYYFNIINEEDFIAFK